LADGPWRFRVLERAVFVISRDVLPVDRESAPPHLVTREPVERELALAREVVARPGFGDLYGSWMTYLHPAIWEEVQRMARANGTESSLDLRPLIEMVGVKQMIDQMGLKRVVEEIGPKRLLSEMDLDALAAQLTSEERQELIRRLQG
jgi:hypothetical protein